MPRNQRSAKRQGESSFLTPDFLRKQELSLKAKLTDCRKLRKLAKQGINVPSPDERRGDVLEQALKYGDRQIAARQLEECGKIVSQVIWALDLVESLLARKKSKKGEEEYGKCFRCKGQIPERRLIAIPWARRCVSCQEKEDVPVLS